METTLNKIRDHLPCPEGWQKLLGTLGKAKADDEPVSIIQILDSNGLDDALWCLRAVVGHDREIRLFAVWCARQVEHLMTDERSKKALVVAERHANEAATERELVAARSSAGDAINAAVSPAAANAAAAAAAAATIHLPDAARRAARDASYAAWFAACASEDAAGAAKAANLANSATRSAQEKELRRLCAAIEAKQSEPT